ncbi:hypothetical protein CSUI_011123 [Cystoisospora suis]|uniref:Uncharacterized protein n=1 Tax=Cystoisospora suis TaxID=483139 RepID=A0A2C6KAP9_9APIC|nr:hypothetical protein CSUI_011123 [Cystoisospora suis]
MWDRLIYVPVVILFRRRSSFPSAGPRVSRDLRRHKERCTTPPFPAKAGTSVEERRKASRPRRMARICSDLPKSVRGQNAQTPGYRSAEKVLASSIVRIASSVYLSPSCPSCGTKKCPGKASFWIGSTRLTRQPKARRRKRIGPDLKK